MFIVVNKVKNIIRLGGQKLALLDSHTLEVLKKSASSTIVKVIGMLLSLLLSVFLARELGADGIGILNLSNSIINILIVFCLFGTRQLIVKEVAIAYRRKDYRHIGNIMHSAFWFNGVTSLLTSLTLIFLSPWLAENIFNEPQLTYPLMLASLAMSPQVFSRIYSAGLIGYKKIWQSNLVDQALSIVVTGLFLTCLWLIQYEINLISVAICYAIGKITVTISIGLYWKKINKRISDKKLVDRKFLKVAYSFFIISLSSILFSNADAIILGIFSEAKEVGLYTIAAKIALMTSFFLQVTNASLSPKIASLYASGNILELEKMVQKVTIGLFCLGISTLLIFVFFGKPILAIWGEEFEKAYTLLIILGIGQLINLGTGAVGLMLMMTGFEKLHGKITLIFAILNIMLAIIFIWLFNAIGAAIATSISIAGLNLTTLYFVNKKLNISTVILLRNLFKN